MLKEEDVREALVSAWMGVWYPHRKKQGGNVNHIKSKSGQNNYVFPALHPAGWSFGIAFSDVLKEGQGKDGE